MRLRCVYCSKYISIVNMGLLWRLSTPSSVNKIRGDGTVVKWKNYVCKVFVTIVRRHPSAFMNTTVNDFFGNDVINVEDRDRQKRSATHVGGQMKISFPAKERHFPGTKKFSPETTFALRCKQITKTIIYLERNNWQNFVWLAKNLSWNVFLLSLRGKYSHVVLAFHDHGIWPSESTDETDVQM